MYLGFLPSSHLLLLLNISRISLLLVKHLFSGIDGISMKLWKYGVRKFILDWYNYLMKSGPKEIYHRTAIPQL